MKTSLLLAASLCIASLTATAQLLESDAVALGPEVSSAAAIAAIPPTPDGYFVTEVGVNHRRWTKVTPLRSARGDTLYQTNSYIELPGEGLYYVRPGTAGPEWAESRELIEAFPGGAIARQGQIQIIFPNDLSSAIEAQTPAGHFRSTPLGLTYADSSLQTNIWVLEITNCQGRLISPNQVLYPAALQGENASASIRYTYRFNGWEQDVLLDHIGSLPLPEDFGLDSRSPTLTVQVISEMFDPPTPATTARAVTTSDGAALQDEDIDWGTLRLGEGKAYFGQFPDAKAIPVFKRWISAGSRHLLVEEIPFSALVKAIMSKDEGASSHGPTRDRLLAIADRLSTRAVQSSRFKVQCSTFATRSPSSPLFSLPTPPRAKTDRKPMQLASAARPEPALTIDYSTITTTQSNYVFACDSTYYISGAASGVNLNGTTVLEGGSVLKFASTNSAKLLVNGPLVCQTGPYRMAVLTSKHDSSVGQAITGASGSPTNTGAIYIDAGSSQTNAYAYLRVSYAGTGLRGPTFTNGIWHSQFVQCGTAVVSTASTLVPLRNVLLARCTNGVVTTGTMSGEHLTVDQCSTLLSGAGSSGNLTNCLLTAVTTLGSVNLSASPQLSSSNGVYQTVGAAGYYLADGSTNRQAGLTNINAALLAAMRARTTYPPVVMDSSNITSTTTWSPLAQRMTAIPDIGFAYDPLDYLCRQITLSYGQTLLLTNGVAVGLFGSLGFDLSNGNCGVVGQGRPEAMNRLAWYPAVQEQSISLGGSSTSGSHIFEIGYSTSVTRNIQLRFTELPMQGLRQNFWSDLVSPDHQASLTLQDCQVHALTITEQNYCGGTNTMPVTFLDNLFNRSSITLFNGWTTGCGSGSGPSQIGPLNMGGYVDNLLALTAYNNLFRGCTVSLTYNAANTTNYPSWTIKDSLWDGDSITFTGDGNYLNYIGRSNNGFYNTSNPFGGSGNVTVTNLLYDTGTLGPWYIGTAQPTLVNAGSRNATNAGLYHFTMLTSQVKETNTVVDIGFHLVAADTNGLPIDTDGDGIPDYFEDKNGNGVVNTGETDWKSYNSPNGLSAGSGLQVFTPLK